MRLLVSPNSVDEALICASAVEYIDVIDVKKPDEGSLGANYPWVIQEIRRAVPESTPLSATLGDVPFKPGTVAQAALGAAVAGANYIKVGLYGCTTPEQGIQVMAGVVRAVKDYNPDATVVAAGYADAHRVGCVNPLALPSIKDGSALFDHLTKDICGDFVTRAHDLDMFAALAGSVKACHLADLAEIGTDIVGVRGAVCTGGDRNAGTIQVELIKSFRAAIESHVAAVRS
jgi:uncharacterized protein (UPF0264 family)